MSQVTSSKAFIFHTDLGAVVVTLKQVKNYDVEDVIRDRALSQARCVQFLNQGRRFSPNHPRGARTLDSVYTNSGEELPS
jgi:hypothetical protein